MINVALIGCGYWGSKLKRYIVENENFSITDTCNILSDLSVIWDSKDITAVVVATPNETHYPIIKSALLSGKNVLAEKPLTLKAGQCEELRRIAADRNLVLLVEYTPTFSKALEKARIMVEQGKIGNILGLEMMVRHLGRFGGGSVYWILGSHMLAVLDMFIPIEGMAFSKTDLVTYEGQVETGVIHFQNGRVSGQIAISLNYSGKETRVIIYGEKGTIIYDAVSQPSLFLGRYERQKWVVASELPTDQMMFRFDEANNLRYAVEYFHQALKGEAGGNIDRAVAITRILEGLGDENR